MRKQVQMRFNGHEISTNKQTACDAEALARLERTLNSALDRSDTPRVLRMDIHFPVTRTADVNQIFRAAQADYVKTCQRKRVPVTYVGYKDLDNPSTIRLAVVYDSTEIVDDVLARNLERTINRKIDGNYSEPHPMWGFLITHKLMA